MNENNKNAEKWTIAEATELFDKAIEMTDSENSEDTYDFIGEVARDLNTYRDVFTYLKKTFPSLETKHKRLLSNLEANCFSHGKKGKINPAMAIMNLKANYEWTDRVDNTTKGKEVQTTTIVNLGTGVKPS